MPWHTASQGEWIDQIAQKHGFADGSAVLSHGNNADLKQKRPDPSLLLPGDQVFIPDKTLKEVQVATGQEHRFKLKRRKAKLKLIIHGEDGTPLKSKPFTLTLRGATHEGTSGGDGLIEIEVPAREGSSGRLEIDGHVIPIRLGHLDPVEEVSGAQARLHNLGYHRGPVDGQATPALDAAIRLFQKINSLEETGEFDDTTRNKLKEAHGC